MKDLIVGLALAIGLVFIMPAKVAYGASYNNYVALGDSVASGAGLGASENRSCDRDSQSYPYLLAGTLGINVTNLACSGAKVDEGLYDGQFLGANEISPQIEAAFANGTPDLMTITIGANDLRWSRYVRDCYSSFTCGSNWDNTRFKLYLADLNLELNWALWKINYYSGNNPPKILLNGYYSPIGRTGCSLTEGVQQKELGWLNSRVNDMNRRIKSAAGNFSNVEYVPMNISGHRLCDSRPWIQDLNEAAPFHPNAQGQASIMRANLKALQR